jgi:outer membrane protein assembly factor BamB
MRYRNSEQVSDYIHLKNYTWRSNIDMIKYHAEQISLNAYLMSFCGMFLLIFIVAAFSAGCSDSNTSSNQTPKATKVTDQSQYASSVWPKLHQNNFNTGLSMVDTSTVTGVQKWAFYAGDKVDSSPAIGADGTIYVGTSVPYHANNDGFFAVSQAGEEIWGFKGVGAPFDASAAIGADGTIYIGGQSSNFAAVTPSGGTKWLFEGVSNLITTNSTPAIGEDGTVYFGADDGYVYAMH